MQKSRHAVRKEIAMSLRIIDILPKIVQWEAIPYAADFCCQECGKSGITTFDYDPKDKMIVVGWCECNIGLMLVYECPHCHSRFRFHSTLDWHVDYDDFDLQSYHYRLNYCVNGEEIKKQLEENEKK